MKAPSHPVLPNVESRLAVLPGGRSSQGHYLPGRPAAHIDSAQRQLPDTPGRSLPEKHLRTQNSHDKRQEPRPTPGQHETRTRPP